VGAGGCVKDGRKKVWRVCVCDSNSARCVEGTDEWADAWTNGWFDLAIELGGSKNVKLQFPEY
jgi:hypothetical protein